MRIASLNVWGGRVLEPLLDWVAQRADDTDVLCLQEVYDAPIGALAPQGASSDASADVLERVRALLPGWTVDSAPAISGPEAIGVDELDYPITWGLVQAIRPGVRRLEAGLSPILTARIDWPDDDGSTLRRDLQWVRVDDGDGPITVANFHGLWQRDTDKIDTPERLLQSKALVSALRLLPGPTVVTGDFNLRHDGRALGTITRAGWRDLIKEYGVFDTRSTRYTKPYRYADYAFIDSRLVVERFSVPEGLTETDGAVSDHRPLLLDVRL